jgi:L-ascorbate metabolism protein UlaG (beta-lactamase superfamily)
MSRFSSAIALALLLSALPSQAKESGREEEKESKRDAVELTWMSIANWYFKVGPLRIVMDGYITRVPQRIFVRSQQFPADQYAFTSEPWSSNATDVLRVRYALEAEGRLDYVLAGHSHFDHTYDTALWAALTGAEIIGGHSTCLQARSQGLPASQCTEVSGSWVTGHGERLQLAKGVTVRVVRFNHSGNASNPFQHFGRELSGPPTPDAATGGFRAGVAEDFPNGGGGRAFLFTIGEDGDRLSFFVNNSASAFDLNAPVTVGGVSFGSPLENLGAAMRDARLTHVDAWIGTGGLAVAQLVVPVLRPKVYIPNHWDGLFNPFWAGLPFPFKDANLAAYLDAQGIQLMPQQQYFDKYRLDENGVTMQSNREVKQRLGFSDVQPFSPATASVARAVSAALGPEDCDQ